MALAQPVEATAVGRHVAEAICQQMAWHHEMAGLVGRLLGAVGVWDGGKDMEGSYLNRATPSHHPFLDGFSLINHPFWVFPCMETPTSWILSGRNDGKHFDGFWITRVTNLKTLKMLN